MMQTDEGVDVPIPDEIVPPDKDFWQPLGGPKPCWVCGAPSNYAYLDIGWQHPDCDAWPEFGGPGLPDVEARIIRGHRVPDRPMWEESR